MLQFYIRHKPIAGYGKPIVKYCYYRDKIVKLELSLYEIYLLI